MHLPEQCADHSEKLPAWTALLHNRTAFRAALAAEVGISIPNAKEIVQFVLNGGWAAAHRENAIRQTIGEGATRRLMESQTYKQLRADFQTFWAGLCKLRAKGKIQMTGKS